VYLQNRGRIETLQCCDTDWCSSLHWPPKWWIWIVLQDSYQSWNHVTRRCIPLITMVVSSGGSLIRRCEYQYGMEFHNKWPHRSRALKSRSIEISIPSRWYMCYTDFQIRIQTSSDVHSMAERYVSRILDQLYFGYTWNLESRCLMKLPQSGCVGNEPSGCASDRRKWTHPPEKVHRGFDGVPLSHQE
jgi:hypothetical protein